MRVLHFVAIAAFMLSENLHAEIVEADVENWPKYELGIGLGYQTGIPVWRQSYLYQGAASSIRGEIRFLQYFSLKLGGRLGIAPFVVDEEGYLFRLTAHCLALASLPLSPFRFYIGIGAEEGITFFGISGVGSRWILPNPLFQAGGAIYITNIIAIDLSLDVPVIPILWAVYPSLTLSLVFHFG